MLELSLIFIVALGALACAAGLARWNTSLALGDAPQARILSAVARTSEGFFWQALRKSLLFPATVGLSIVVLSALRPVHLSPDPTGDATTLGSTVMTWGSGAGWGIALAALGLVSGILIAFVVVHSTLRVASRLLEATRDGTGHASIVLLRGSGISALLTDALATVLIALALILHTGEFADLAHVPASTLRAAVWALPALALGATVIALIFHCAGVVFGASSRLTRVFVLAERSDLDDERSPTLVSDLAAAHVGFLVSRSLDAFVCSLLTQIGLLLLCAMTLLDKPLAGVSLLGLLTLPLLARAIGLVATTVAILAARVDPAQDSANALGRGIAITFAVSTGGLAGASAWLLGPHWIAAFIPGALGCAAACALGPLHAAYSRLRGPVAVLGVGKQQVASNTLLQLATPLEAALVPVLIAATAVTCAYYTGAATPIPHGGVFGLVMALAGAGSVSAFMLTLNLAEPLASNVRTMALLQLTQLPTLAQRHATRVASAARHAAASARAFFVFLGCLAALTAALATQSEPIAQVALGTPVVLWSGVLGVVLVVAVCGLILGAIAQVTRLTSHDASSQLSAVHEGSEFTPNYRSTVETASNGAFERARTLAGVALLAPLAVALALRAIAAADRPLAAEGLFSFIALSAVVSLTFGFVAGGLGSSGEEPGTRPLTYPMQDEGSEAAESLWVGTQSRERPYVSGGVGELVADVLSPTAQLFTKSLTLVCLMLSSLLT